MGVDITERKRAEEACREAEVRYRALFEQSPEGILLLDIETGATIEANEAACRQLGYTREEFATLRISDYEASETPEETARHIQTVAREGIDDFETLHRTKSGEIRNVHVWAKVVQSGGRTFFHVIFQDITSEKRAKEELLKQQNLLKTIIMSTTEAIFAKDRDGNYHIINEAGARMLGYGSADVIGHTDMDLLDADTAREFRKTDEDVMLSGQASEREEMGFIDGRKHIFLAHKTAWRDDSGNIIGIIGVSSDITARKQTEEALVETLDILRKAIGTTIQVLVSAVEVRDPYTSGHQIRSADLARAIAKEMELPPEKIEGLRMAASIHDLGKLSIPVEILAKPTKLSDIEFALIKEHARKGYEMLKDVESPWPLAEIVYQHHERIDGSGYPRKLKGEEICTEARILSIADVVEAMASHRPYRAGLGIDAALNEIEKNKGIFYDAAVADACLRLFREKGFKLSEA